VYKKIYDNIYFVLQKNRSAKNTQVETLYLLIALTELGRKYWLTQDVLATYLCIARDEATGKYFCRSKLNYFTIVVSLFYMKNKVRFSDLREFIIEQIVLLIGNEEYEFRLKKAELVFLLLDSITCPYIELSVKRKLLILYDIKTAPAQNNVISAKENWFTNWKNFEFGKALDAKNSLEVY
jgi:hypothetical protein